MSVIHAIFDRLLALFVEDGAFALFILSWLAGGWVCIASIHFPASAESLLLFLGFSYLLTDSVRRASRRLGCSRYRCPPQSNSA
jgi:hypothetical protein